ncbi:hypothetical protein [Hydrogenophaga sp.]|uniref:hypothetical protein n=1 Tax=Hydrogenophaga sp. TaxID=1904254 RepID=UPI003F709551
MVERTRRTDRPTPEVTPVQELKVLDHARPSAPGEHWLVLGAGIAAWMITRKSPSFLLRTAGLLAGSALVGRAASGRDGWSKLLRYTPLGRRIK